MTTAAKPKKFEEELKDLEEIVGKIDSGELTLEDSIGAFERGVSLVRSLNQKLDEIEKKVEVLSHNSQGDLRTAPLCGSRRGKSGAACAARILRAKTVRWPPSPGRIARKNGADDEDDIPF